LRKFRVLYRGPHSSSVSVRGNTLRYLSDSTWRRFDQSEKSQAPHYCESHPSRKKGGVTRRDALPWIRVRKGSAPGIGIGDHGARHVRYPAAIVSLRLRRNCRRPIPRRDFLRQTVGATRSIPKWKLVRITLSRRRALPMSTYSVFSQIPPCREALCFGNRRRDLGYRSQ